MQSSKATPETQMRKCADAQMPKPEVDHQRNPAVYYGKSLLRHWFYIWRLRQRHPDRGLRLYKDDINAAFQRILCHPDIAPAFATVLQHMLCIPVGLIFGSGFSPSFVCNNSECRALATTAFPLFIPELTPTPASATALTDVRALAATASELFKSAKTLAPLAVSIRLPDPPSSLGQELMDIHLVPDPLHPPLPAVFDHRSHHVTFVDNNIMTAERDAILAIINASVLSAYFLYGSPGDDRLLPHWPKTNTNRSPNTTRSTWG
jgi:hypothetical protein